MDGRQVNENLQREGEYTKILADRIVERYHKDNIVLSSHLVAFIAFQILAKQNPRLDLYGLLRLPTDDFSISYELMSEVTAKLIEVLKQKAAHDQLKLSPALMASTDELIRHGIDHLGNYHVAKALRFHKSGELVSDDFRLLYYYHNRLDNYGLDKFVQLPEPAAVSVV